MSYPEPWDDNAPSMGEYKELDMICKALRQDTEGRIRLDIASRGLIAAIMLHSFMGKDEINNPFQSAVDCADQLIKHLQK